MIVTLPSHYQITEKFGLGGMGEVYRAGDTNFERLFAFMRWFDLNHLIFTK